MRSMSVRCSALAAILFTAAAAPLCAQISSPFDEALAKELSKEDKAAAARKAENPRAEMLLDIAFISVGVVVAAAVIIILTTAGKRRAAETRVVRLCRTCRGKEGDDPALVLAECRMCDPPTLYCASHLNDHIHRK
jgi:hypothetical protein